MISEFQASALQKNLSLDEDMQRFKQLAAKRNEKLNINQDILKNSLNISNLTESQIDIFLTGLSKFAKNNK